MAKYQRPRLFYRELYVISSPYSCPSNRNLKLANPALRPGFQEALLKTSFYSPVIANFRKIELPSVFCQRNLFLKIIRLDNRTKWRNDKKLKKKKTGRPAGTMQPSSCSQVFCCWGFFRWMCLFSLEDQGQTPLVTEINLSWKVWVGKRDDRILSQWKEMNVAMEIRPSFSASPNALATLPNPVY